MKFKFEGQKFALHSDFMVTLRLIPMWDEVTVENSAETILTLKNRVTIDSFGLHLVIGCIEKDRFIFTLADT